MKRLGAWGVALALATGAAAAAEPATSWEAYRPKTAEDAAADKVTAAENQKYVDASRAVDARNAAKKQAYEAALAAYQSALARREADIAASEAAFKAAQAAYEKAKSEWEEVVKACEAGDRARCKP